MWTLALVGFLGGLVTGISPCILPVLPVIFFSGANRTVAEPPEPHSAGGVAVIAKPTRSETLRPYRVIGGLVLSFSVATLLGSALLSALHLPQDAIRWIALAALVAIGLGLIFPRFQQLLETPFARLPQRQITVRGNGFGLGLALGVLYVPCAGPVLAAIVVAGATAHIGVPTVVLTAAFALGNALPLLIFALAGQRISQRVSAFRRRQREIRVAAGIVAILLAVALVVDVPAALQRAIPDYTAALQRDVGSSNQLRNKLGGNVTDPNATLSACSNVDTQLQNCGPAPDLKGITEWLNTPGGRPITLSSLRGKVVLIDFWAYSCINCQRAIPHVVGWYQAYRDDGLVVIGVHTPEYAFEKVPENVAKGAADLGIKYPVALDNNYSTWTNYQNMYWPAEYLIDADGTVRHVKFGEGEYDVTERLIRQLLLDAEPKIQLPRPVDAPDLTPTGLLTSETYFAVGKADNYGGGGHYDEGSATFDYPPMLAPDRFALRGRWTLDHQGATADGDDSTIKLNYHAKNVYVVVGGAGTVTVTRGGKSTTLPVSGPPTNRQIVAGDQQTSETIEVQPSKGLQVFSFTYG
ncbi:cytochrome c biogenesis protein DipZ [Mycobacterium vicinigordonae]|uniref:Cytochrome c biogenesis protein DipZ n=1 Tax=Mycobacterium vicinigordonae TaxID=1719132 RepID=A0A7D6HXB7_9MYCO|nr:cytochrome c biogenesis protein DipZ [Mycobacterium vicinigordonae]QLL09213.1 cytochrome c biogenesis protein DipZ [Mycobacterium vicinigordonae]